MEAPRREHYEKKKEDESIKISRETSDLLSFESSREMIYDYSRL